MKKIKVWALLLIIMFNLMFVSSCLIDTFLPYKSEDRAGSVSRYILPFIKEYYKIDDSQQ